MRYNSSDLADIAGFDVLLCDIVFILHSFYIQM